MRRKNENKPQAEKVSEDKSKIKFSMTFTGELDWNRDFAGESIDYWFNIYRLGSDAVDFRKALQGSIADSVFDRTEHIFDTGRLDKIECSPEVRAAFDKWVVELRAKDRKALENELAETEARQVALKKRLGKTG